MRDHDGSTTAAVDTLTQHTARLHGPAPWTAAKRKAHCERGAAISVCERSCFYIIAAFNPLLPCLGAARYFLRISLAGLEGDLHAVFHILRRANEIAVKLRMGLNSAF